MCSQLVANSSPFTTREDKIQFSSHYTRTPFHCQEMMMKGILVHNHSFAPGTCFCTDRKDIDLLLVEHNDVQADYRTTLGIRWESVHKNINAGVTG